MNTSCNILKNIKTKVNKKLLESFNEDEDIKVYMNTWKNYNEYGADLEMYGIKDGWMTPEQGLEFCKKYANDEPFINDTDNCPFEVSEYDNAVHVLENMIKFNEYEDKKLLKNAMETGYYNSNDVESYIDKLESGDYTWFDGVSSDSELGQAYVDMVGFEGINNLSYYIDEDSVRRDFDESDERDEIAREQGIDFDEVDDYDVERAIDALVDEAIENGSDDRDFCERHFDYDAFGNSLQVNDGFTFTSDGAIQLI